MCRNRLEILFIFSPAKYILKLGVVGSYQWLKNYLNKCNYREYIKKGQTLSKPRKKVLSGLSPLKGTSECENVLFMSFETWLYFANHLRQLKLTLWWALRGFYSSWLYRLYFVRKVIL